MYCNKCGGQTAENSRFCPFCGAALQAPQQEYFHPADPLVKQNLMCIIGFALACASVIGGTLMSVAGLIVSAVGLVTVRKTGEKGRGFAIAGIITGAVLTAVTILTAVLFSAWYFKLIDEIFSGLTESIEHYM